MTGMMMILDLPTRDSAMEFLRHEPYCNAGAFPEITIDPWVQRIPEPAPGFLESELQRERGIGSASP